MWCGEARESSKFFSSLNFFILIVILFIIPYYTDSDKISTTDSVIF